MTCGWMTPGQPWSNSSGAAAGMRSACTSPNLGLATLAIGRPLSRIWWYGMHEPDILCYLPAKAFARSAPTWQELKVVRSEQTVRST